MIGTSRLPYLRLAVIGAAAAGVLVAFTPQVVSAQMMESYRFQARDRASIAFGMREVENRQIPQQVISGSGGGGSLTQLVCGSGGGGSTAAGSTANSSCVILNGVNGSVGVGQDNAGNQNANANSESSTVSDAIEDLSE